MTTGKTLYRIRTDDVEDFKSEANRIFALLSTRLDKIEGFQGKPEFYDQARFSSDVVVIDRTKGLILADDGDPQRFWRLTIDSAGTLTASNIGRSY